MENPQKSSIEQTALENHDHHHDPNLAAKLKLNLLTFSGSDDEDFRYFEKSLENYFKLSRVGMDRRAIILKVQLSGPAEFYFEQLEQDPNMANDYQKLMNALREKYVTKELILSYEIALGTIKQGNDERPKNFLARIQEMARLAQLKDDHIILMRFRAGLKEEIRMHCMDQGAETLNQWYNYAENWWKTRHIQSLPSVCNLTNANRFAGGHKKKSNNNNYGDYNGNTSLNTVEHVDGESAFMQKLLGHMEKLINTKLEDKRGSYNNQRNNNNNNRNNQSYNGPNNYNRNNNQKYRNNQYNNYRQYNNNNNNNNNHNYNNQYLPEDNYNNRDYYHQGNQMQNNNNYNPQYNYPQQNNYNNPPNNNQNNTPANGSKN